MSVIIRQFAAEDIDIIVSGFAHHDWHKPKAVFDQYLCEQKSGERLVWVAYDREQFAGYITLKWQSDYLSFREQNLPEIKDLNVLPIFQKKGIGSNLLETAEVEVSKKNNMVGLGVGLYEGYGNAQKLYSAKGYVPQGKGLTYKYKPVLYGETVSLDDDLVFWLTKKLR